MNIDKILEDLKDEIQFPTSKEEIVDAVKAQSSAAAGFVRNIPDKMYDSYEDLKSEVKNLGDLF